MENLPTKDNPEAVATSNVGTTDANRFIEAVNRLAKHERIGSSPVNVCGDGWHGQRVQLVLEFWHDEDRSRHFQIRFCPFPGSPKVKEGDGRSQKV